MEMPRWRACAASLSRIGIGTRIVVVAVAINSMARLSTFIALQQFGAPRRVDSEFHSQTLLNSWA